MDGFRGLDRMYGFELDMRLSEVREHLRSAYAEQGSTLALHALSAFDFCVADFFGITR
jgi:hypothetical protein